MTESIGKIDLVETGTVSTFEAAPLFGVTTDTAPIRKTQYAVGVNAIQGPGANVTVSVNIKGILIDTETGTIDLTSKSVHVDKNGTPYFWADVTVTETPEWTPSRIISTAFIPCGDKVGLNVVDGKLTRNYKGTFAKEQRTHVRSVRISKYVPEQGVSLGVCRDVTRVRVIANHRLVETYERTLTPRFNVLRAPKWYKSGPLQQKFEGYRIFVYVKEDGIELSTGAPNKKLGKPSCPKCHHDNPAKLGEGKAACTQCGWVGMQKELVSWAPKYKGFLGILAERFIPAIELEFYNKARIAPKNRPFSATCSQCSKCWSRMYGQNQDEPAVGCTLGLRDTLSMDFHWEQDLRWETSWGSGLYLLHSEGIDDATCLPTHLLPKGMDADKRREMLDSMGVKEHKVRRFTRGKTQYYVEPDGEYLVIGADYDYELREPEEVDCVVEYPKGKFLKFKVTHNEPTKYNGLQQLMLSKSSRGRIGYEIPSWFSSTQKANEVIYSLTAEILKVDMQGLSGKFAKSALKKFLATYDVELPANIFPDEDTVSVQYALSRFDGNLALQDIVPDEDTDLEASKEEELESVGMSMAVQVVAPEPDVVPDMERVAMLMERVHPVVKALMFESNISHAMVERYPAAVQLIQDLMLAESNPRMIRAGDESDYLVDMFDDDACIWFSYEGSMKQAHGAAGFHAKWDNAPARVDEHAKSILDYRCMVRDGNITLPAHQNKDVFKSTLVSPVMKETEPHPVIVEQQYTVIGGCKMPVPFGCTVDEMGNIVRSA